MIYPRLILTSTAALVSKSVLSGTISWVIKFASPVIRPAKPARTPLRPRCASPAETELPTPPTTKAGIANSLAMGTTTRTKKISAGPVIRPARPAIIPLPTTVPNATPPHHTSTSSVSSVSRSVPSTISTTLTKIVRSVISPVGRVTHRFPRAVSPATLPPSSTPRDAWRTVHRISVTTGPFKYVSCARRSVSTATRLPRTAHSAEESAGLSRTASAKNGTSRSKAEGISIATVRVWISLSLLP